MFKFFNWFFGKSKTTSTEDSQVMKKYLIVGLGNIGEKYENTRHNIGFKILDYFCSKEEVTFSTDKLADRAEYKLKGRLFIFIKPNTYMNLSGKAVQYWLQKENIPLENLLVITDDLNLAFGTLRIKTKGSDGGHNGLKSIISSLQSNNFWRLRIGIGHPGDKSLVTNFVLKAPIKHDMKSIEDSIFNSYKIFSLLTTGEFEKAMLNLHSN